MEEEEAILIGSVRFSFFVNYATPAPRAVPLSSSSSRSSSSSYLSYYEFHRVTPESGCEPGETGIDRRNRRDSTSLLSVFSTLSGDTRDVTLRASGPCHWCHAYRSLPDESPDG
jgi:hypothetical protein